uniref:SET domain bifurcated histone lysine methyltransferase 1a n=1 Tax=Cyprinus carpio carpio TaxID=630221 RepID=A0A9J8BE29_CYPCA
WTVFTSKHCLICAYLSSDSDRTFSLEKAILWNTHILRWIQAEVDRNPHLMQRREQLGQVEEWVKRKERDSTYTCLLYSNAHESVLECESVMKGLYGMLGLEYRDEDSEEEGGGEPLDVIHLTDEEEDRQENSVFNGDDDDDDISSKPSQEHEEIKLKVSMEVLGKRQHNLWCKGTVQEVQTAEDGLRYKVEFKSGKEIVLPAHHVASLKPALLKDLFIGCRVVASSKDDEGKVSFNAAVLVELPERKNRMRFLVFYDNGEVAYLSLPDLHLVCKQLKKVWKDIEDETLRLQVKEYLRAYPNPIAVVLRVGQDTKAMRNGKFETCTVLQLDGSLIQICFKKDKQKEWIYKGSEKLEHIVNIKERLAKDKPQKTALQKTQHKLQQPYQQKTQQPQQQPQQQKVQQPQQQKVQQKVQQPQQQKVQQPQQQKVQQPQQQKVQQFFQQKPHQPSQQKTQQPAATSRLCFIHILSAKRPAPDEEEECASDGEECVSKEEDKAVLKQHQCKSIYLHHRCCPACLDGVRPSQVDMHRGQNPLLIPLLFKFRRMTARRRIDGKVFFHIFYRSPCGRSLCDMQEVQEYLFETRGDFLFLEMFCMDPFVLVNRARPPSTSTSKPHLYLPDISDGREVLPVPCVNEVDNTLAPNISYTKDRVPAPGVSINTSSDFLIGCDCTDGCLDRSKCACHQLTIEATSLRSGGPVDVSAGYTHKRLPTTLPTGVYECNPLCRCDPRTCSNRLVQHGLQLRLELFMTQHKGWGIRCKDDVAKGTFVCVFTGKIVNEDRMNEDDTVSGNDYLANLDFIEGVEKLKEGYESEAYCSDTEVESNKKTITMKTGPLWKNTLYQEDSSSSEVISFINNPPTISPPISFVYILSISVAVSDVILLGFVITGNIPLLYIVSIKSDVLLCPFGFNKSMLKSPHIICNLFSFHLFNTPSNLFINVSIHVPGVLYTQLIIIFLDLSKSISMVKHSRMFSIVHDILLIKLHFNAVSTYKATPPPFFLTLRVKPLVTTDAKEKMRTALTGNNTRRLFSGEDTCYIIDARQEGNLGRFINHSCSPNLFVQNVFVDTHDLRFPWVAFFASKRIKAGAELTWDYNYEVGSVEGKVLLCCCGSLRCTGRLL